MRTAEALARGRRIYARIRGWGVASDGSGGITRPEPAGQMLALRRAYARAGYGPDSVGYFEGPGTGTSGGAAVEPGGLSRPLRASVSAMGFGGIDTHLTLEGEAGARRDGLGDDERRLAATPQDAELFLFGAASPEALGAAITRVAGYAARISFAEMADLARA